MNQTFGRFVHAALTGGIGLWMAAVPAHADSVFDFGLNTSISPGGPGAVGTANATYINNSNGGAGYLGELNPGITSTLTSPGSGLTASPSPTPGGLTSAALNLSSYGSQMNVSASMASGTDHMYGYSIGDNVPGPSGVDTNEQSTIQFNDTLTFIVTGGGSDTVTIGFALDGNIGNSTGPMFGNSWSMAVEETFGAGFLDWNSGASLSPDTSSTTGWNNFSFTNNTQTGFNFMGALTVTNGEIVPIQFIQQLSCNNGTICDYSNTGQLSLILPSDVTYTSASGAFLTQQGESSVPEPSSLVLLGLGIAAIGCARFRRSTR